MKSKHSKKSKSGTPVLKFARTLDEFKSIFASHNGKFDALEATLKTHDDNFDNIREYIERNTAQINSIKDVLTIIQDKVGYFETKGLQHFRKHYLGPLTDLDALKKDVIHKAENAFKGIRETKEDHMKRMVMVSYLSSIFISL